MDVSDITVTSKRDLSSDYDEGATAILLGLRERIEWRLANEWHPGGKVMLYLDTVEVQPAKVLKPLYERAGWSVSIAYDRSMTIT